MHYVLKKCMLLQTESKDLATTCRNHISACNTFIDFQVEKFKRENGIKERISKRDLLMVD